MDVTRINKQQIRTGTKVGLHLMPVNKNGLPCMIRTNLNTEFTTTEWDKLLPKIVPVYVRELLLFVLAVSGGQG